MNGLLSAKIRKYIKSLRGRIVKYDFMQAYDLLCKQIKTEEALTEEEMENVKDEIRTRLRENWPFEDSI